MKSLSRCFCKFFWASLLSLIVILLIPVVAVADDGEQLNDTADQPNEEYDYSSNYDLSQSEELSIYEKLACVSYNGTTATNDESFQNQDERTNAFYYSNEMLGKSVSSTSNTGTFFYIIECENGYLLSNSSGNSLYRSRYSNGNSNNHLEQKWMFIEITTDVFVVYSCADDIKCLTVNPSNRSVSLSQYSQSEYQFWKMRISSSGNYLECAAPNPSVSGYRLKIDSTTYSFYVSDTDYTPIGFFDVNWYVPTTGLSYNNFYIAPESKRGITPQKTPTNAKCSAKWMTWTVSNSSILNVTSNGIVTGLSSGTVRLRFIDKITNVYGTCTVYVTEIPNGNYFLNTKNNSEYAKIRNNQMTSNQKVDLYVLCSDMSEQWTFLLNTTTGYYSIKSALSGSTSYYLCVENNTANVGQSIVINSATENTLTDSMKWKITRNSNDTFLLIPKIAENTELALVSSNSSNSYGYGMILDNISNNTNEEWELSKTSFECWYSDDCSIAYWDHSPTIYIECQNVSSTLYFNESISCAIEQWEAALGITFEITTNASTADILCYGGSKDFLERNGMQLNGDAVAVTQFGEPSIAYTSHWGSSSKIVFLLTQAKIYIPDLTTVTYQNTNQYRQNYDLSTQKEIATHEFGHAMGYAGHSLISDDVMYDAVHNHFTLQQNDIKHLLQLYR